MVEAALGQIWPFDGVLRPRQQPCAPITEMAVEDFDAVMDANVRVPGWCVGRPGGKASSRVRRQRGAGTSNCGGLGNAAGYSVAWVEGGHHLLAKTLAAEWAVTYWRTRWRRR